ncbi:MAG: hypothetical protein AVO39_04750 [delta proteobacterium MLS_D]|jgi:hypothetical protein|nr:MAG: hypothetical protein AVO39_04750 [delta proteobacterium MLS_D]
MVKNSIFENAAGMMKAPTETTPAARLLSDRFSEIVENTDWDEKILDRQSWFDGACLCVLLSATAFLVPLFVRFFQG